MNAARQDVEPLPTRLTQANGREYNTSFLNYRSNSSLRTSDDDERECRVQKNNTTTYARDRLKICEAMLLEVVPYHFTVDQFIAKYSIYANSRNSSLKYVKKIPNETIHWWWKNICKKPRKMEELRAKVARLTPQQRRRRIRLDPLDKVRYGSCPFAERFVVEKRHHLVHQSGDHGVKWCSREFNRVLETPWLWEVAKNYVSPVEARRWATRGTVQKKNVRDMEV